MGSLTPPTSEMVNISWNDAHFCKTFQTAYTAMLEQKINVDVTLTCDNVRVECHRLILAACSPYFASLISENHSPDLIICLVGVKGWQLLAIVSFMYQGKVTEISLQQFEELCEVAKSLKIHGLYQQAVTKQSIRGGLMSAPSERSSLSDFGENSEVELPRKKRKISEPRHLRSCSTSTSSSRGNEKVADGEGEKSAGKVSSNQVQCNESASDTNGQGRMVDKNDNDTTGINSGSQDKETNKSLVEEHLVDSSSQSKLNNRSILRNETLDFANISKNVLRGKVSKGRGRPRKELQDIRRRPTRSTAKASISPSVDPFRHDDNALEIRQVPATQPEGELSSLLHSPRETAVTTSVCEPASSSQPQGTPPNDLTYRLTCALYLALYGFSIHQSAKFYGIPEPMLNEFILRFRLNNPGYFQQNLDIQHGNPAFPNIRQRNNDNEARPSGIGPGTTLNTTPNVSSASALDPEPVNTRLSSDTTVFMLPK